MQIELLYGNGTQTVTLPDDALVIAPNHQNAAPDQVAEVHRALATPVAGAPLRDRVPPGLRISVCDGTRPQPRHLVVPALLEELEGLVRPEDVTVLIATGTHRGNTEDELRAMLGDVVDLVRVHNHDARDSSQLTWRGRAGDVPVWLNSNWVEADVRITTGFVEPHFFAGFSGGPKMVAPGLAALDTVLALHNATRIGSDRATWGVCEGNPVHDSIREVTSRFGDVDFALDVVLNRDQQIVSAFGGDLPEMHRAARRAARAVAMCPVPRLFDVVVTTNAGFPLDQNLYQAVKGMSAAAGVVRQGGTIVCAAECRDGFPDHGSYRQVLTSAASPAALLADIEARSETVPDQWQVQVQARVQQRAEVVVFSSGLGREELAEAHLGWTDDVSATVQDALRRSGPGASVCVLPEGPLTIPYVRAEP